MDTALVEYMKPALKEETGLAATDQTRRAEWLITAAYSLVIGPLCGGLLNLVTPRRWAQACSIGALDRLLLQGQQRDLPVQLTLSTGKIYIGMPAGKIVPMFSGYRDSLGRVVLTSDYESVYKSFKDANAPASNSTQDFLSQSELAIRVETIVTATLFSPRIYAKFNPDWKQKIIELAGKPPPQESLVELRQPLVVTATVARPARPAAPAAAAAPTSPDGGVQR